MFIPLLRFATRSTFGGFPPEVTIIILLHFVGVYFRNPKRYVERRARLRTISPAWNILVVNTPQFWNNLLVTQWCSEEYLLRHFSRSKALDLSIAIILLDNLLPIQSPIPPRHRTMTGDDIVHSVIPYLSRCIEFFTIPEDRLSMSILQSNPLSMSRLVSFSLPRCGWMEHPPFETGPILATLPPSVQFFRTSFLPCRIPADSPFPNVTTIVLQGFYEPEWPSWTLMASFLQSAVSLRSLSLRRVGFTTVPVDFRLLVVPRLTDLDLALYGVQSCADLLSTLSFPSLERLHLSLHGDVGLLARCAHLLHPVLVLTFDAYFNGAMSDPMSDPMVGLVSHLHNARVIDMRHDGDMLLNALFDGTNTGTGCIAAPLLHTLCLGGVHPSRIRRYADCR
ncbi:hypothetical protein DFH06DRAFT_1318528 [Mycena polygramma]|nr:hypothetical protein DFH06DRAFT_1318528 [Mycena polygramma]